MKLDSKLFDRIRIKPDQEALFTDAPSCEFRGCSQPGGYRAPKGRMREGEYFSFCLDHVRLYNKSYNYFAGMADDDVARYQKASATGHRPTWTMGVNASADRRDEAQFHGPHARGAHGGPSWSGGVNDPFGFFDGGAQHRPPPSQESQRTLKNMERRSFAVLDLEGTETGPEIKTRYKLLVKRLHPDANGGDRSSEDKLREIIQAYGYLKAAGFC